MFHRELKIYCLFSKRCRTPEWIYFWVTNFAILVRFDVVCIIFKIRSDEVYSIQHYVIKIVSDLRQGGGFLWVFPVSSTNKNGLNDIAEIFLKISLSTITLTHISPLKIYYHQTWIVGKIWKHMQFLKAFSIDRQRYLLIKGNSCLYKIYIYLISLLHVINAQIGIPVSCSGRNKYEIDRR